jgi:hypothetical protein
MSLTYTTYTQQLANLMVETSSAGFTPEFQTFLPGCIDYAEQRIYREVDLLYTVTTDNTTTCSSGVRNFTLPTGIGTFITVQQISVFSPAGTTTGNGTRVPLIPVSRDFLDNAFPTQLSSQCGTPEYFSMRSNSIVAFGPAPDGAYLIEVIGTQRPTPLSSGNPTTILTLYVPELFMAASMVFGAGFMRDFGSQADNAQMSASWETQYQTLLKSAATEQFRAKFQSQGWTAEQPNPVATPQRA